MTVKNAINADSDFPSGDVFRVPLSGLDAIEQEARNMKLPSHGARQGSSLALCPSCPPPPLRPIRPTLLSGFGLHCEESTTSPDRSKSESRRRDNCAGRIQAVNRQDSGRKLSEFCLISVLVLAEQWLSFGRSFFFIFDQKMILTAISIFFKKFLGRKTNKSSCPRAYFWRRACPTIFGHAIRSVFRDAIFLERGPLPQ
jgi:hypothetical protein